MAEKNTAGAGGTKSDDGYEDVPMGGDWYKWESPGQFLEGKLVSLENSTKYAGKGMVARMQTADGVVAFSAPLVLEQAVRDNSLIGRELRIIFTGERTVAGGELKEFKVQAKRA